MEASTEVISKPISASVSTEDPRNTLVQLPNTKDARAEAPFQEPQMRMSTQPPTEPSRKQDLDRLSQPSVHTRPEDGTGQRTSIVEPARDDS